LNTGPPRVSNCYVVYAQAGIDCSYPAAPLSVTLARAAVGELAEQAGADRSRLDCIRVAVSEAVTNAVVHAYPGTPGAVHVTAGVADFELWVLVADDGDGFQAPSPRPGLGWGLPLIADASDSLVIAERAEGGTEIRMHFKLADAYAGDEASLH
jgi:anti-sigma regulatory factor (Ser/Thr protein kinase)